MTKRCTAAGVIFPLAYAASFLFFLAGRFHELRTMPLNELGDFLAGALALQAHELFHTVAQQGDLVEVSRQQFLAEMEALQFERERIQHAHRCVFQPIVDGISG